MSSIWVFTQSGSGLQLGDRTMFLEIGKDRNFQVWKKDTDRFGVPQNQELEYALDINSTNVEIIEELRPKKDSLQLTYAKTLQK